MSHRFVDHTEVHYTVGDLAKMWKCSAKTIRRLFANEQGVIDPGIGARRAMRIPSSVAETCTWRGCKREFRRVQMLPRKLP